MPSVTERQRTPLPRGFNPAMLPQEALRYVRILAVGDRLEAEVGPYVGRLPLLDGSELTLEPKVPIEDIGYLIFKAGQINEVFWEEYRQMVSARSAVSQLDSLFHVHVARFLDAVAGMMSYGPLRHERSVIVNGVSGRGRPSLSEYRRIYPQTFGLNVPSRVSEVVMDVAENRLARYICKYLQDVPLPEQLKAEALEAADYMDRSRIGELDEEDIEHCRELLALGRLPASRSFYFDLLEAGIFILEHAGFRLHGAADTVIRPLVVNMERVFEDYIRNLVREAALAVGPDLAVIPGRNQPRPLYIEGGVTTQPDVLVYRGVGVQLVLDVKYKESPSPADHYQVLAYARSYTGVKRCAIVTAAASDKSTKVVQFNVDGIRVEVFAFDLTEIQTSEERLAQYVVTTLSSR